MIVILAKNRISSPILLFYQALSGPQIAIMLLLYNVLPHGAFRDTQLDPFVQQSMLQQKLRKISMITIKKLRTNLIYPIEVFIILVHFLEGTNPHTLQLDLLNHAHPPTQHIYHFIDLSFPVFDGECVGLKMLNPLHALVIEFFLSIHKTESMIVCVNNEFLRKKIMTPFI